MDIEKYWEVLNNFNWHFKYENDHNKWRENRSQWIKMISISYESEDHKSLYDEFLKHHYSEEKEYPKPKKPKLWKCLNCDTMCSGDEITSCAMCEGPECTHCMCECVIEKIDINDLFGDNKAG